MRILLYLLAMLLLFGCAKTQPLETTLVTELQPVTEATTEATTEPQPTTQPPETTVPSQPKVALLLRDSQANSRYEALIAALEASGVELSIAYAGNDQSLQDAQAAAYSDQALLIVEPVMTDALDVLLQTAQQPLLILDRLPERSLLESNPQAVFLGYAPEDAATAQAGLISALPEGGDLNGDGTVACLVLQGPQEYADIEVWSASLLQALGDDQPIELLVGDESQAGGNRLAALALSRYGRDIEVILCSNALMAQGAVEAIEAGGWTAGQDVYVIAWGNTPQLQSLIRRNAVFGTVLAEDATWCRSVIQTLQAMLQGQLPQQINYLEYTTAIAQVNNAS